VEGDVDCSPVIMYVVLTFNWNFLSAYLKMSKVKIAGKLLTINAYSQLVIKVTSGIESLEAIKTEGNKPWYMNADNEVILRLKIPNWNMNERKMAWYDDMTSKNVTVEAKIKHYDYLDEYKTRVIGVCLTVSDITAKKE
jgi:hypothetical protein